MAATNSMAEAFLQAATHAPHPIHDAASIASFEIEVGRAISFASGIPPVFTEI